MPRAEWTLTPKTKTWVLLTEYIDGQGRRRVTNAAASKTIVDALPPQKPRRFIDQPVAVRLGRPART
jgi:4-alpha-glucanotransferase